MLASAAARHDSPTAMQTRCGDFLDIAFPNPSNIHLTDIAEHLAKENRYCGATQTTVSVAQHSVFVSVLVEQSGGDENCIKFALLHDAKEAYTGDLIQPFKVALRGFGASHALKRIDDGLDRAIYARFGLPWPTSFQANLIKRADMVALATEKRDHLIDRPWGGALPEPAPTPLRSMPWPDALDLFLKRAGEIGLREVEKRHTTSVVGDGSGC